LRRERFDVAFNFTGSDRSLFAMIFIGAPNGLAYVGRKHFWNRWIPAEWVARSPGGQPVYEQRRQLLAAGGGMLMQPARFDFAIPPDAIQWAQSVVPENAMHFSINASTPEKEWPMQHWIALAKTLLQSDQSLSIVATASSKLRERDRLAELAREVNNPRLRKIESPEIPQLAAILQRCRLQIGGDSGILHLAMALNVPTLTVFKQHSGIQDWLPVGPHHRHVIAPTLAAISVEQVSKEALEQLR
jgi:ADP-heptose:LPS heptosyltransferase